MNRPAHAPAEAPWVPLKQQWQVDGDEVVPQVRWWIESGRLIWEMKTALPLADRATFKTGGFVEGLWDQDVAEFFIADRDSGHYQEFNLSPGGAWWSATFAAPRVRVEPQPEWPAFGVRTEVVWTEKEWIGRLSLPLPEAIQPGRTAVNFTAITAGRSGRRFYSLAGLGGATPDFHRPGDWIAL